jgi:hypothetical protein
MPDSERTIRDEKLDLLLELTRDIHAELCGTPEPRRRSHLHIAGKEPPAEPAPRLADVVQFPQRGAQNTG